MIALLSTNVQLNGQLFAGFYYNDNDNYTLLDGQMVKCAASDLDFYSVHVKKVYSSAHFWTTTLKKQLEQISEWITMLPLY